MSKRAQRAQLGISAADTEETTSSAGMSIEELQRRGYGLPSGFDKLTTADKRMVRNGDGSITIGKFTWTSIGMKIDSSPSVNEWMEMGGLLRQLEGSLQWLIGDWFVYGETSWGKTYDEVAEALGYEVTTLYQFSWVARSVKISLRRENLFFGHHKLVAPMSPEEQDYWLQQADYETLSVSQLRNRMKGEAPTPLTNTQRIVQNALKTREEIERIATKSDGAGRSQWKDFAVEQARWWAKFAQQLE
jgi:hypothetical protein